RTTPPPNFDGKLTRHISFPSKFAQEGEAEGEVAWKKRQIWRWAEGTPSPPSGQAWLPPLYRSSSTAPPGAHSSQRVVVRGPARVTADAGVQAPAARHDETTSATDGSGKPSTTLWGCSVPM